jgi:hypothetical protein
VKRGRRRRKNEASFGEDKVARPRKENKKQGRQMLSGELKDSPLPLSQFIDLGEPCSQNRARRTH